MKLFIIFSAILALAFARTAVQKQIMETGPKCPFDDPLIKEGRDFNVSLPPLIEIHEGSTHEGYTSVGLTSLSYEYTINLLLLTVDFQLTLGSVETMGDFYEMSGYVDATPIRPETLRSGNFTGKGAFHIALSDVDVAGKVTLFVNLIGNKVTIRALDISKLSFGALAFDMGPNFLVNGEALDWAEFNENFKPNFEQDWANMKTEITEKLRISANNQVEKYTLEELLELIGGDTGCNTAAAY